MDYIHTKDKALYIGQKTLEKLEDLKLPLLPGFYELWYTHFCKDKPELSNAIQRISENANNSFTFETCVDLYKTFIDRTEHIEHVQEAGQQIRGTLQDVNLLVSDVKQTTTQYNASLENLSHKLDDTQCPPDDLKTAVESVAHDTRTVLEHNHNLENQLILHTQIMADLQRDLDIFKQEALTDGLTTIANRKAFETELRKILGFTESNDQDTFSLILMDIDHFKNFNDTFGHLVGDQVLKLVAKTLLKGIKGQDFVARYGGEEFAILLPSTNQHAALQVANNLRKAVAKKQVVNRTTNEKLGRITLSAGVTEFFSGDTQNDLIQRADKALYEAKTQGRNTACTAKLEIMRD